MLMRKTGLILATLAGALMVMACGGKGYGTTAPPSVDKTVAATPSLTFTPSTLGSCLIARKSGASLSGKTSMGA